MNPVVDADPFRDEPCGDSIGGETGGMLLAMILFGVGLVAAATVTAGPWWKAVLLVGAGAGAMGVLHWIRVRRLRQRATARIEAVRARKQEVEEAREAAADRAEKLEEMSAATSQFLAEISHAFRRPLTLTLGPLDTVLEGRSGGLSEEARTQLRVAERNGTRLLWLVNQLLDLAELETDSMVLAPTEGDLSAFVGRCLRSFEDLAERRNVALHFESFLDDPAAWFDPSKMETMLANLLSSAFRAAEEGTSIRATVRPASEETAVTTAGDERSPTIELLVEYTGTDVLAGDGEGPFRWSVERDLLREPAGVSTSVGLRLVDELADLHGGHLQVDRSVGGAVQFAVRLPRQPSDTPHEEMGRPAESNTDSREPGEETGQDILALSRNALSVKPDGATKNDDSVEPPSVLAPTSDGALPGVEALPDRGGDGAGTEEEAGAEDRTTVLVIDDNAVICTLVRAHLEPEYRVAEAHDGAEGYPLARRLLPDLVITDVMMPEVDGFELCRKIKEDPDIDHVPVVFLTARADLEDKVEGFETGADAYLTKPFEPEELIARVESLIATRRALRESFRTQGGSGEAAGGQAAAHAGLSAEGLENAEAALPQTAESRPLKEQIEEAIAEHLTDPEFGVSELASVVALSPSQLRRRMKEIYDRTPVQLIRRRRLEAGARLLRERPDATIGEVGYAVGFNSQSYFSRSFRKEFGMSPSQYRNEGVTA